MQAWLRGAARWEREREEGRQAELMAQSSRRPLLPPISIFPCDSSAVAHAAVTRRPIVNWLPLSVEVCK